MTSLKGQIVQSTEVLKGARAAVIVPSAMPQLPTSCARCSREL